MALIGRNAQSTSRNSSKDQSEMAKETNGSQTPRDGVISIIGPGMRVDGDCTADGTLRVTETIEIEFNDAFSKGTRSIPMDRIEELHAFLEGGKKAE